jgi:hypothetical protein
VSVSDNAVAVIQGGQVKVFGNNAFLGGQSLHPISGLETGVTAIGLSKYHLCSIQGGARRCLGNNAYGNLGNGSFTDQINPVTPGNLGSNVIALAVSNNKTCAVSMINSVTKLFCFGLNLYGEVMPGGQVWEVNSPADVLGVPNTYPLISPRVSSFGGYVVSGGALRVWGGQVSGASSPVSGFSSGVTKVSMDSMGFMSPDYDLYSDFNPVCVLQNGGAYCKGLPISFSSSSSNAYSSSALFSI